MLIASIVVFIASYVSVFYPLHSPEYSYYFLPLWFILIFNKNKILQLMALFLFVFFWTHAFIKLQVDKRFDLPQKQTVTLQLEIVDLPKQHSKSVSFIAKPLRVIHSNVTYDWLKLSRIKLNWYHPEQIVKAGQIWQMQVKLKPPHGFQNGAGFDYERWLFVNGIAATGYVVSKTLPTLEGVASHHVILLIRSWLVEKIAHYSEGPSSFGLFTALAIGDKSHLDDALKQLFSQTGTAHLLVISGLHIGLLSGFFYLFAGFFWKVINKFYKTTLNQQDFAIIWAWLAALIYAALAGFSLPTVRALIMLSILYISLLKRMSLSFLNVLSLALIIILIVQPLAMLSLSFWLSFIAVLVIAISQFIIKNKSKIHSLLWLQLCFSLLFIPLNAVVFNQLLVTSFFANLVLIPVMSLIVIPLNLVATFLAALDLPWVIFLFQGLDIISQGLQYYLNGLFSIFGEPISLQKHSPWLMSLSSLGLIMLVFLPKKPIIIPSIMIMMLPWLTNQNRIKNGEVELVFFDVGMGTAILVSTQHYHLLYDLGPGNKQRYQPAKWVLSPYLQNQGIQYVDKTIISHSDQDHYGGLWALKSHLKPNSIVLSGTPKKMRSIAGSEFTYKNCHTTKDWHWDGVLFQFFSANMDMKSDNDRSCVLKITAGNFSALLTADIEKSREKALIEQYSEQLKSTVLSVPHHGSKTSSSVEFLKAVNPKLAIISSGFLNHWGFPKKSVLSHYAHLKIQTLNTAVNGRISIQFKQEEMKMSVFRQEHKAIWY